MNYQTKHDATIAKKSATSLSNQDFIDAIFSLGSPEDCTVSWAGIAPDLEKICADEPQSQIDEDTASLQLMSIELLDTLLPEMPEDPSAQIEVERESERPDLANESPRRKPEKCKEPLRQAERSVQDTQDSRGQENAGRRESISYVSGTGSVTDVFDDLPFPTTANQSEKQIRLKQALEKPVRLKVQGRSAEVPSGSGDTRRSGPDTNVSMNRSDNLRNKGVENDDEDDDDDANSNADHALSTSGASRFGAEPTEGAVEEPMHPSRASRFGAEPAEGAVVEPMTDKHPDVALTAGTVKIQDAVKQFAKLKGELATLQSYGGGFDEITGKTVKPRAGSTRPSAVSSRVWGEMTPAQKKRAEAESTSGADSQTARRASQH